MPDFLTASLVDALPLPILLVNRAERIVSANPAARLLFGRDIEGRAFVTVLRQPALGQALEEALQDDRPGRVRLRISSNGREMVAMATV